MESYEHVNGQYPYRNDVAVLCIFWIRTECFSKSFASVREAKPKTLLLWQDGPKNEQQREKWLECQKIATDIDWECDVYRFYHEENIGIWPGAFYSHKWAFTKVDKCIILEDDVVPRQSFYRFCKELLDKYENDERIGRITGKMQVEKYRCPYSYFFSDGGSVWGWATWKRVADTWEEDYSFIKDDYAMSIYRSRYTTHADKDYLNVCIEHSKENRAHWETVSAFAKRLNNQLDIVPAINLVENVGIGESNSVHSSNVELEDMPKALRSVFFSKAMEMEFPMQHPKYVFPDLNYTFTLREITGANSRIVKARLELERYLLYFKHGHANRLFGGVMRRIRRAKK
jgi:hypothetical protein